MWNTARKSKTRRPYTLTAGRAITFWEGKFETISSGRSVVVEPKRAPSPTDALATASLASAEERGLWVICGSGFHTGF